MKQITITINRYSYILLLTFFFFLVYLFFIFKIHPPWNFIYSDMQGYIDRAYNFSQAVPLSPYDSFYPVGLTFLYSPFFMWFDYQTALRMIAVLQAAFLSGSLYLIYLILEKYFHSSLAAWIGFIFTGFYFPFISYIGFYLAEIPFSFFMLLGFYLFLRAFTDRDSSFEKALSAGLMFGLALICKGTLHVGIVLIILLTIVWYRKNIPWRNIMVFIFGIAVFIAAESIHASLSLGKFSPTSTDFGLTAYLGQAHLKSVINSTPTSWTIFYNNNSCCDLSLTKNVTEHFGVWEQGKFMSLMFDLWKAHPIKQFLLSVNDSIDLFRQFPHWPIRDNPEFKPWDVGFQKLFIFVVYLPMLLYWLALLISKYWNNANLRKFTSMNSDIIFSQWAALGLVTSVIVMAFLAKGEERYLVPFQFFFIIYAAFAWSRLIEFIKAKSKF